MWWRMRSHLRLLAVSATMLLVGAACSTRAINNPAVTTTTSSVGTKPGPAPAVIIPTPAPSGPVVSLDTSSTYLTADDAASRTGSGPRTGTNPPAVAVGAVTSTSAYFAEGPEQEFRSFTNADRAIVGAPLVARDQYLDQYARAQAQAMSEAGGIYHSNISVLLCCYWTIGENVGVGPNARQIQYAYEASFGHFRNLTNETFSRMGIGVYVDSAGRMWTAATFAG